MVARKTQVSLRRADCQRRLQPQLLKSKYSHDVLWVVVHASVAEVKALEVGHRGRLNHDGELERVAERGDLLDVVRDEAELICDGEVLDLGRG